ncbi:Unknown protein sequence [Pseudomonas amygdali pv. sesami]|nr:Unknown protein sequence [Pseudomonas amygdali pv. sesami]
MISIAPATARSVAKRYARRHTSRTRLGPDDQKCRGLASASAMNHPQERIAFTAVMQNLGGVKQG